MAEEEPRKVEPEAPSEPPPAETPKDVAEEKPVIPPPPPPPEEKPKESKALAIVEKPADTAEEKISEGSAHRDRELARVETQKRMSLIRAWEESEKCKAENKAHKKLSAIGAWENCKKASVEAELKKIEEKLEKQKAEYVEKMKNKIALIHKSAEEKRAAIEAKRGEDMLKAEELAANYRAKGTAPKKLLSIF
ncbi:remorin-like [Syzygium oleosum]|uniref:remorin-like n=1 Tax=Syzygium oleosum TaxID=219896 RepID=UPI0011D21FB3|nr:remorin-like [Syzygium oleosum]